MSSRHGRGAFSPLRGPRLTPQSLVFLPGLRVRARPAGDGARTRIALPVRSGPARPSSVAASPGFPRQAEAAAGPRSACPAPRPPSRLTPLVTIWTDPVTAPTQLLAKVAVTRQKQTRWTDRCLDTEALLVPKLDGGLLGDKATSHWDQQ